MTHHAKISMPHHPQTSQDELERKCRRRERDDRPSFIHFAPATYVGGRGHTPGPNFFLLQTSRYLCPIWVALRDLPTCGGVAGSCSSLFPPPKALRSSSPPRPSLCRGRALRAPCSCRGGYLGVTAKERKTELLMHMLNMKHETNLLL